MLGLCTRPRITVTNTANISTTKYTVFCSVPKFNVIPLHVYVHTYFKTSKAKGQCLNGNIYSTWGSRYSAVFEVLKYYVNYNNI